MFGILPGMAEVVTVSPADTRRALLALGRIANRCAPWAHPIAARIRRGTLELTAYSPAIAARVALPLLDEHGAPFQTARVPGLGSRVVPARRVLLDPDLARRAALDLASLRDRRPVTAGPLGLHIGSVLLPLAPALPDAIRCHDAVALLFTAPPAAAPDPADDGSLEVAGELFGDLGDLLPPLTSVRIDRVAKVNDGAGFTRRPLRFRAPGVTVVVQPSARVVAGAPVPA